MNFFQTFLFLLLLIFALYFAYLYIFDSKIFTIRSNFLQLKKWLWENFFKPGRLVKFFNDEEKLTILYRQAGQPFGLNHLFVMHIQEASLFVLEIYILISLWFRGDLIKHLILYLFLAFLLFQIPLLFLRSLIVRRQKQFDLILAPAIDLLILCLEGGMHIYQSIESVAKLSSNIVSLEFARLDRELQSGLSLDQALINMQSRMKHQDFNRFISLISQNKELGGSLAQSLKIQAELIRQRKKQKAEELARTASIKIMFPLVCCIFPALLIIYLTPAIMQFFTLF